MKQATFPVNWNVFDIRAHAKRPRGEERRGEGNDSMRWLLKLIKRFALNLFRGLTPSDKENHNNTLPVRPTTSKQQEANICNWNERKIIPFVVWPPKHIIIIRRSEREREVKSFLQGEKWKRNKNAPAHNNPTMLILCRGNYTKAFDYNRAGEVDSEGK